MNNEELVEKFNRQFPAGSTVRWRSVASPHAEYREYTVRAAARLHHGQPVTFFVEKTGMCSIFPEFVDYEGK